MRKSDAPTIAILASVGFHVALATAVIVLDWLPEDHEAEPRVTPAAETAAADEPAEPMAIEIVQLPPEMSRPDHTVKPDVVVRPATGATVATGRAAPAHIATGRETGRETGRAEGQPSSKPGTAEGSKMMSLHRAPDLSKPISGDFLDRFLENSKPLAPAPNTPERVDGELADARRRARSGDVGAREEVVALADAQRNKELKSAGGGTYKADKDVFTAKIEADGTAHIKDAPNLQIKGLGARFDVTDAFMRSHGIDPYSSKKLKFLDDTREQRYQIGVRYKHEQLGHSAQLAAQNVERLWASVADLAGRKRAMFDLWDEAEDLSGDSADRTAGAEAARKYIEGVIRARLVGPSAYTPSELAELNARRHSKAVFAPYSNSPVRVVVPDE